LVLTGEPAGNFSKSYESFKEHVRWYEWGGSTITEIVTRPGRVGADESPLLKVLKDHIHKKHVHLSEQDKQRLYIWLDGNAPFYGTYEKNEQFAQRNGQIVALPLLQ
jgi:hypothetical protein